MSEEHKNKLNLYEKLQAGDLLIQHIYEENRHVEQILYSNDVDISEGLLAQHNIEHPHHITSSDAYTYTDHDGYTLTLEHDKFSLESKSHIRGKQSINCTSTDFFFSTKGSEGDGSVEKYVNFDCYL